MPDGSIILMGGLVGPLPSEGSTNDTWRSLDDGATWTEQTASAGWSARGSVSSVVMPDGSIVIMGGWNGEIPYYNDVWRSTDYGATWTEMTAPIEYDQFGVQIGGGAAWTPRGGQSSVVMPDGSIVLMGGATIVHNFNDVWRSTDYGATWTEMTPPIEYGQMGQPIAGGAAWLPRYGQSSVVMPDGSIVLMGGYLGQGMGGTSLNDVWRSTDDGATWTEQNARVLEGQYDLLRVAWLCRTGASY